MLSAIREKIFDWKTKRLEKQVAQLRKDNEKLVHYIAEASDNNELVTSKQECESKMKTQQRPIKA